MMSSPIWIVACPLGMFAMGGIAWVLTRLPGRRAQRLARVSSRATCMPMGAQRQTEQSAASDSAEREVAGHV
jgi:hypothetical protein